MLSAHHRTRAPLERVKLLRSHHNFNLARRHTPLWPSSAASYSEKTMTDWPDQSDKYLPTLSLHSLGARNHVFDLSGDVEERFVDSVAWTTSLSHSSTQARQVFSEPVGPAQRPSTPAHCGQLLGGNSQLPSRSVPFTVPVSTNSVLERPYTGIYLILFFPHCIYTTTSLFTRGKSLVLELDSLEVRC